MKLTANIVFTFLLIYSVQVRAQPVPGELAEVSISRNETIRTLNVRFETTRFRDDPSNIQFWFKKAVQLLYENEKQVSRSEEFRRQVRVALDSLINYIDTDLHNNYANLRYGHKVPFVYDKKPGSIALQKVEQLSDTVYTLSILLKIPAYKTSLKGRVVSALTGDPIPGATIMTSKTSGYTSDSLGNFLIRQLSTDTLTLTVSTLGYPRRDTTLADLYSSVNKFTWAIHTICDMDNQQWSIQRNQDGNPAILLQSGESNLIRPQHQAFTSKYNVQFIELGETRADQLDCIILFNRATFRYLDEQYGKAWRSDLDKDVIGVRWYTGEK